MRPASPCVMRTPARHLASTLAVRRIGNTLPIRMTDTTCAAGTPATGDARGPIRFPVCFDVVACRRRVRRSREIRLRQRHRVNRKARAMRRESKRDKGHRKTRKLTPAVIGGNVSGTHPYSADDAGACDPACRSSMPQMHAERGGMDFSVGEWSVPSSACGGVHGKNVATMRPRADGVMRSRAWRFRVNTDAGACLSFECNDDALL